MANSLNRRTLLRVSGAAAAAATLAGCTGDDNGDGNGNGNGSDNGSGNGGGGDFPDGTLTLVNHYSEGGGLDQNFRELQPHWEDEIGGTWQQSYQSGAGTRNGQTYMLNNTDPDMHSVGMADGVEMGSTRAFDLDDDSREPVSDPEEDFAYIGSLTSEATIIRVRRDDDRFETFEEFVDYAQNNPGDLTMGSSGPTNRFTLAGIQLLEEIDVDMRIVPYDGGGPVETALLQEEVDVIPRGVYNSRSIEDDSRALAIYWEENEWAEITDDAPPINDELGSDIPYEPSVGANVYYTTAEAADNHPDRYDTMVDSFEAAVTSDAYLEDLDEIDEYERLKVDFQGPEDAEALVLDAIDTYSDYVSLFEEYVE